MFFDRLRANIGMNIKIVGSFLSAQHFFCQLIEKFSMKTQTNSLDEFISIFVRSCFKNFQKYGEKARIQAEKRKNSTKKME